MASPTEIAQYRAEMAELLEKAIATTRELERWLDVTGGWVEATEQIDLDADPTATFRIVGALLLRKARLHTVAVLRANETSNLHSLAVQMRPVLECAGQVVFIFHNLMIAPGFTMEPERAMDLVGDHLNADYYGTMIAATKGQVGHQELLEQISGAMEKAAALDGLPKPKMRKGRSLKQADKVATLRGGTSWYNYVSEYFCHGRADWVGYSWSGGVVSMDLAPDVFAFASLMDYLVGQVAVMNAHAALCPVAGDGGWGRVEAMLAQLREVRETSKAARDAAVLAFTSGGATED
ncbi:hypothetical protein [Candidatus Palauibacter sp.]|uniref:hypothetical protein n=1 Tax=Candidatus Palauibacter sp. TaxID=3101350 RepID=UPI003B519D90